MTRIESKYGEKQNAQPMNKRPQKIGNAYTYVGQLGLDEIESGHSPQETVYREGSPEAKTWTIAAAAGFLRLGLFIPFNRIIVRHFTFHATKIFLVAAVHLDVLQFLMTSVMVLQQPALHEFPYRLHVTE